MLRKLGPDGFRHVGLGEAFPSQGSIVKQYPLAEGWRKKHPIGEVLPDRLARDFGQQEGHSAKSRGGAKGQLVNRQHDLPACWGMVGELCSKPSFCRFLAGEDAGERTARQEGEPQCPAGETRDGRGRWPVSSSVGAESIHGPRSGFRGRSWAWLGRAGLMPGSAGEVYTRTEGWIVRERACGFKPDWNSRA